MVGLLNRNPYGGGLLNQPLTFSAMYPPSTVNAQNPLSSYAHLGKPMPPDMAPTQIVKGILGGMGSLAMQAHQAMPWGGNDPSAIGIDTQAGTIDPGVMIPFATDVAGMATTGSLAAPAMKNATGMGIRAYHGSPHDFDRFSMDKIGTGEGAQAYGHGLYFAENEAVARTYKDILGYKHTAGAPKVDWDDPRSVAGYWIRFYGGDKAKAREYFDSLKRSEEKWFGTGRQSDAERNIKLADDAIAVLETGDDIGAPNPGKMYEVDINASPDEFLDWDKPLSEQPAKVREALDVELRRYYGDRYDAFAKEAKGMPASDIMDMTRGRLFTSPRTAEELRAAGIKGIRYKDAGSRGLDAEGGTSNYVVFDDNIIGILKKYGIAGLTAGGAGAAMLGGTQDASAMPMPSYSNGGRF